MNIRDYLELMVSPAERTKFTSEGGECVFLQIEDPESFNWGEHGDSSVHGMVVKPSRVEEQESWLKESMRVLKPGGHLMMISPDMEPMGYTGACMAEEVGFTVRDSVLVAESGDDEVLHYSPKAHTSEREAGLGALPERMYAVSEGARGVIDEAQEDAGTAEYGVEGDIGLNRITMRRNFHPTVKPISIMEKLLKSIPVGGTVLDPFMGSGTTGLACLRTGHDFLGIEREPEYLPISRGRTEHWASLEDPMKVIIIKCEGTEEEVSGDSEPVSFLEALGI